MSQDIIFILGKQVGVITEQQTQFSIEIDGRTKGIRLDLYVEVEGEMIDVEIQTVKLSKKKWEIGSGFINQSWISLVSARDLNIRN